MIDVKWFNSEDCEYPDLDGFSTVDVWVYHDGCVEHAIYHNPSMDSCWFVLMDGTNEELLNAQWATYTTPNEPT